MSKTSESHQINVIERMTSTIRQDHTIKSVELVWETKRLAFDTETYDVLVPNISIKRA